MADSILTARKTIVNVTDELQLDAFTTDDKTIIWGYNWVKSVGIYKRYLSEKNSKYYLPKLSKSYSIVEKSLGCYTSVRVKGINATYNTLNRQVFTEVLVSLVELGHHKLLPILAALATEALEERAKESFGIDASSLKQKEVETKAIVRQQGKIVRRQMTDSIKSWCERNDSIEKLQGYCVYCSDTLNVHLFGKKSKQLRIERGAKTNKDLRDTFTSDELRAIERIEDRVILLTDTMNIKPTDAIKKVISVDSN